MLTRGDFHIHSTASDGSLSPSEIVIHARNLGIDTIALADHNTVDGILEASAAGRQYGVSVIPAIELSTRYKNSSIHLLGYFRDFRFFNSTFREILQLVRSHRANKAREILSKFLYIDASGDNLSISEGMGLLRAFGAAVVLAHPVRISQNNLEDILYLPFDGLEAKYCHNSYSDTNFFVNLALRRFSFYTGGSDFHTNKNNCHCSIGEPYLDGKEIEMFIKNSGVLIL